MLRTTHIALAVFSWQPKELVKDETAGSSLALDKHSDPLFEATQSRVEEATKLNSLSRVLRKFRNMQRG